MVSPVATTRQAIALAALKGMERNGAMVIVFGLIKSV